MSVSSASIVDGPNAKAAASCGFETQPFDEVELLQKHGIDTEKCVWIEVSPSSGSTRKIHNLVLAHIAKTCDASSFSPSVHSNELSLADLLMGMEESAERVRLTGGLGVFRFVHEYGGTPYDLVAVHQRRGPIVGTNCGTATWENLVLLCDVKDRAGRAQGKEVLVDFCNELLASEEKTAEAEFSIYRWHVQHHYWQHSGTKKARSIESVVLPTATKDKVIGDLDSFLTRDTYKFYIEHGIPYKRSYLFWGVPGGGKTSLIQAIAGKYKRNLCFMQPTDPRITDDALLEAIKEAPSSSIIVLEDIDALFAKDRSANAKLSITFSGLLNALDGITNPDGQIFVLTTNFRDNLDSALIRNGRVDLHVEFKYASGEQMEALFTQFYPSAASGDAARFKDAVQAVLGERNVNMAGLQHYFITHRTSTAEDAIKGVDAILADLKDKRSILFASLSVQLENILGTGTSPKEENPDEDSKLKGAKAVTGQAVRKRVAGGKAGGAGKAGKKNSKKMTGGGVVNVYINTPPKGESSEDDEDESDDSGNE